jgi:hypothetical protein
MTAADVESSHREIIDPAVADRWFAALDQRPIGGASHGWIAQVLGIHVEADGLWLQIGTTGEPVTAILLHVSASTTTEDVLEVLERRAPGANEGPEIVDLTPLARAGSLAAPI